MKSQVLIIGIRGIRQNVFLRHPYANCHRNAERHVTGYPNTSLSYLRISEKSVFKTNIEGA